MLKKKIKSILIRLGLILVITISVINIGTKQGSTGRLAYANSNTYSIAQQISDYKEVKNVLSEIQSEGRQSIKYDVLIYHSHTHEEYVDTNVVLMGEDLKMKLESKGLRVKVINDDFTKNDYNNSYYESRKMLKEELKNNNYKLVLDIHRDSIAEGRRVNGVDKNGNSIGKIMFVTTTENPNYQENKKCIEQIKGYIDKFGENLTRKTWEYKKGVSYYGSDLGNKNGDGNVILVENSFNTNSEIEVRRANTYLSSAINEYIKSLIK